MAVLRIHVLYETKASCHRPEDVVSSLRGLPTLKVLSATLRPELHTPSTRTEGPLARDDAEAAPVLYLSLSLSFFLALSLSFSPRSPFSFSLCILRSLSYSSRRGACDQQPGTRRELLLAPGIGASPLTFRTIRELPVLLLRGCVSKTTPRQLYSAAIGQFIERIRVLIPALVIAYCVGSLARWMTRFVLDV